MDRTETETEVGVLMAALATAIDTIPSSSADDPTIAVVPPHGAAHTDMWPLDASKTFRQIGFTVSDSVLGAVAFRTRPNGR